MDIIGLLVTVSEKIASPIIRLWKHPQFDVEHLQHQGYHMTNAQQRWLNLAIVLRNAGRGAADTWRAEVRGARLELSNLDPGGARVYRTSGEDVIEWQSVEPVPSTHTRTVACKVHLGDHAELALTVSAPHMKPLRRVVVVDWRDREPSFAVREEQVRPRQPGA